MPSGLQISALWSAHPWQEPLNQDLFHCITLPHTVLRCITLQHTASHCNTLLLTEAHSAHGSTPQHTVAHGSTLQHTTAHCNTLQHTAPHEPLSQTLSTASWWVMLLPLPHTHVCKTKRGILLKRYVYAHFFFTSCIGGREILSRSRRGRGGGVILLWWRAGSSLFHIYIRLYFFLENGVKVNTATHSRLRMWSPWTQSTMMTTRTTATLQHNVTYCNILQQTATHCNNPYYTAPHYHTLQMKS